MTSEFVARTFSGTTNISKKDLAESIDDMTVFMMRGPSPILPAFTYMSDVAYAKIQEELNRQMVDSLRMPSFLFGMPVYTFPAAKFGHYSGAAPAAPSPPKVIPREPPFQAEVHGWQVAVLFAVGAVILSLLFSVV